MFDVYFRGRDAASARQRARTVEAHDYHTPDGVEEIEFAGMEAFYRRF